MTNQATKAEEELIAALAQFDSGITVTNRPPTDYRKDDLLSALRKVIDERIALTFVPGFRSE